MKLLSNIILVGTLLSSSPGFSVEGKAEVAQEAEGREQQAFDFLGLSLEILPLIFDKLNGNSLGAIASTSRQMRDLAQESISKLDDGVQLENGTWMRLRTALEQGKISEISEIKDPHSLLSSDKDLRNSFINAIAREADRITSNDDLGLEGKQENRDAFHKHVLRLGLTSTLDIPRVSKKPASSLADLAIFGEIWSQVGFQVWVQVEIQFRYQAASQVRYQVRGQFVFQVWDQVWNQVEDQVREQVRTQVGDQVRTQISTSINNNFNFTEQNVDATLTSAIDHAFFSLSAINIRHDAFS